MRKAFGAAFQVIGTAYGIIAVIGYVDAGLNLGLKGIIRKVLDSYRHLLDTYLSWIEPYLRPVIDYLSSIVGIELHLYPHWKYVFMPAWLYFINNSRTNWVLGRKSYAIANGLWGSLLAIAIAIGTGVIAPDIRSAYTTTIPVLGIAAFDVGSSIFVATFVGFGSQPWVTTFDYHARTRIAPSMIMGFGVIALGYLINPQNISGAHPVLVLLYVASLALRDMWIATWVARTQPVSNVEFSQRLTGQGSWKLGTYIMCVLLGAVAGIIFAT